MHVLYHYCIYIQILEDASKNVSILTSDLVVIGNFFISLHVNHYMYYISYNYIQVLDEASNKRVYPDECPCSPCEPISQNCSLINSSNDKCSCPICTNIYKSS